MKFTAEQITQMVTSGCPQSFIEKLIGLDEPVQEKPTSDQQPENIDSPGPENQTTPEENEQPQVKPEENSEIETLKNQVAQLNEQLAAAQSANSNRDFSNNTQKSAYEKLLDSLAE